MSGPGRIFTLAQAREALPLVRSLTEEARRKLSELTSPPNETAAARIIAEWAAGIEEAGATVKGPWLVDFDSGAGFYLSLIHISEPTRLGMTSYAVFCLKKKK